MSEKKMVREGWVFFGFFIGLLIGALTLSLSLEYGLHSNSAIPFEMSKDRADFLYCMFDKLDASSELSPYQNQELVYSIMEECEQEKDSDFMACQEANSRLANRIRDLEQELVVEEKPKIEMECLEWNDDYGGLCWNGLGNYWVDVSLEACLALKEKSVEQDWKAERNNYCRTCREKGTEEISLDCRGVPKKQEIPDCNNETDFSEEDKCIMKWGVME